MWPQQMRVWSRFEIWPNASLSKCIDKGIKQMTKKHLTVTLAGLGVAFTFPRCMFIIYAVCCCAVQWIFGAVAHLACLKPIGNINNTRKLCINTIKTNSLRMCFIYFRLHQAKCQSHRGRQKNWNGSEKTSNRQRKKKRR